MSDAVEIEYTADAVTELRDVPPELRAAVLSKIEQLRHVGWQKALEIQLVKKLRGDIHEIRQTGKGAAYRILCFQTGGKHARIVVVLSCVAKKKLLGDRRLKPHLDRADTRRIQWLSHHGDRT